VPSLEVGNAILKTITYLAPCSQAGFVCGTTKPVVFTSRSDSPGTKKNTIALATLLIEGKSDYGKK
jgi:phosphate butyryltransferase